MAKVINVVSCCLVHRGLTYPIHGCEGHDYLIGFDEFWSQGESGHQYRRFFAVGLVLHLSGECTDVSWARLCVPSLNEVVVVFQIPRFGMGEIMLSRSRCTLQQGVRLVHACFLRILLTETLYWCPWNCLSKANSRKFCIVSGCRWMADLPRGYTFAHGELFIKVTYLMLAGSRAQSRPELNSFILGP
jgi:hypothetical protein